LGLEVEDARSQAQVYDRVNNRRRTRLRKLANSRKASHGKVIRAQILLAAYDHPEWSNQQIAREAGCTDRTVRKWRRRWAKKRSIEDLPRPGAPRRFSP
jgi:transcriptional regulator GlxA family with amidase domain